MNEIEEDQLGQIKKMVNQFMRSLKKKIEVRTTIAAIEKDIKQKRQDYGDKDNNVSDKKTQGTFCTYICSVVCVLCLIYIYTYICRDR